MFATADIEGTTLICRIEQEGIRPCRDVQISFSKTNTEDWKGWPAHTLAFRENTITRVKVFSSRKERIYNIADYRKAMSAEGKFIPSVTCHISWRTFLFFERKASFGIRARDAINMPICIRRGLDAFIDDNRGFLENIIRNLNTLTEHDIKEKGIGESEVFGAIHKTIKHGAKVEDITHPNHQDFYHEEGGPYYGECPTDKWERADE